MTETPSSTTPPPKKELFQLPAKGVPDADLIGTMEAWKNQDEARWRDGQASGAVYHGDAEHIEVLNKAMGLFSVGNPLHGDLWPSLTKMESEVIAMTASLLGGGPSGDPDVCGTMTSGGTESIFLSIKAHRQWAEREKGITAPELVCCNSAHAAVEKACDILKIKMIEVEPVPGTFEADVAEMERKVNANTIMFFSSAPSYAHGIIDPIEKLASSAQRLGIGLHVDCCLGGFFLPFAKRLRPGTVPPFDFAVPGVTAISSDTHKYGYAAKGTSVCLFRNKALRRHSYFVSQDWTGGQYITPTPAGSRPGGASAATWAALMRLGDEGFMGVTEKILDAAERFAAGVRKIDGLHVIGSPVAMMVAVGSEELDIHLVGRAMRKKSGFGLSSCQNPPCIHLCTTLRHAPSIDRMLEALEWAVQEVRRTSAGQPKKEATGADVYGRTDGQGGGGSAKKSKADRLCDYLDTVLDMPAPSKL